MCSTICDVYVSWKFFTCQPPIPLGNFYLLTPPPPLPLGISIDNPWGRYGYFLEPHNLHILHAKIKSLAITFSYLVSKGFSVSGLTVNTLKPLYQINFYRTGYGNISVYVACGTKQLGVFLLPLDGMIVHCRVTSVPVLNWLVPICPRTQ